MHKILSIIILSLLAANTAHAQERITVYDKNLGQNETIDVPEGMTMQMDSLLKEYNMRHYLAADKSCYTTNENPEFDRDTYIRRLSRLPNVIEMPYNDIVRQFIDRYNTRGRHTVSYLLSAANFYMPIFEEALEAYQVPLELKYLPIIESSLNPTAVSRAGAAGLWQFMITTGKQYGLEINSVIDERCDPIKSSYAAAHYLSDLYKIFNDWTLAIASYNCGPQNVMKAIKRAGGEEADYWKIYPYLPAETRGYVPAFIAANYVMAYYCEHGICPAQFTMPAATDTIMLNRNVHFNQIMAVCNVPADELKALNPHYRTGLIPGDASPCALRLRPSGISAFIAAKDSVYNYRSDEIMGRETVEIAAAPPAPERANRGRRGRDRDDDRGRNRQKGGQTYTIKKGDNLGAIAARHHTTVKELKRLNNLRNDNIREGEKLRVK